MLSKKLYLICDCMGYINNNLLMENAKELPNGRIKFKGPFTECERPNKNGRIYPSDVMVPTFNNLAELSKTGRLLGELDHPADSVIHLDRASLQITNLWWDKGNKNIGWGEATTLDTPCGRILEGLLHEGVPFGVSSRGVGTGTMVDGNMIVSDGFTLITFDAVGDPSYQDAWQSISESVTNKINKGQISVSTYTENKIDDIEKIAKKSEMQDFDIVMENITKILL